MAAPGLVQRSGSSPIPSRTKGRTSGHIVENVDQKQYSDIIHHISSSFPPLTSLPVDNFTFSIRSDSGLRVIQKSSEGKRTNQRPVSNDPQDSPGPGRWSRRPICFSPEKEIDLWIDDRRKPEKGRRKPERIRRTKIIR